MACNASIHCRRACSAYFLIIILSGCVFTVYSKIVTTNNGQIEGYSQTIELNQQNIIVDTYLGVPFATPPLGDLRFRAPQEVANWTGVKQTMTQPSCCMQSNDTNFNQFAGVDMWNCNTYVSEDCLYLNLWVPRTTGNTTLTTMVWIYGGSFTYGSITLDVYDGTYLAAMENVIVASMQYRMGVQGFLFSGTDAAPGNLALRDQQMAIKWVYENIEHFGGDRTRITLFGESAGSASVSYHLIIPSSMPYFTNAIMQSGTFLANWAIETTENSLSKLKSFATIMNCDNENMNEILTCLKQADATDLENNQWLLNLTNIGTFTIVADGDFLPDSPTNLLKSGNIKDADILLGTTKDEGEYFLLYSYQTIILPQNLWNPVPLSRSEYIEIAKQISGFSDVLSLDLLLYVYEWSNLPSNRGKYWDILDNMLGDHYFICPVRDLALWTSTHRDNNTYAYRFDYVNSNNPWPPHLGSLHGYEIESVFGRPFDPAYNYTEEDRKVSADVMKFFTTFAKTGNVNSVDSDLITWPEFTEDFEEFLVISYNHTVQHGYRNKECSFLKNIAPKLSQTNSCPQEVNSAPYSSLSVSFIVVAILFTSFQFIGI